MSVKRILLQHFQPSGLQGEQDVRASLTKDLQNHQRFQMTLYFIVFVAVLIGFGISVWATLAWVKRPEDYAGLIGVLGISVGGAIELLRRISREWNQSSLLLLLLLGQAKEDQVQELIGKLIDGFNAEK